MQVADYISKEKLLAMIEESVNYSPLQRRQVKKLVENLDFFLQEQEDNLHELAFICDSAENPVLVIRNNKNLKWQVLIGAAQTRDVLNCLLELVDLKHVYKAHECFVYDYKLKKWLDERRQKNSYSLELECELSDMIK